MKRLSLALAGVLALAGALAFGSVSVQAQNCSGQPGANTVCAGPASGGGGLPGFRALVPQDMPLLLTPAKYGATCDGVTDDTAAFVALGAAASAALQFDIEFPINKSCVVWPTAASANANQILLHISNAVQGVINFNGSRFHSTFLVAPAQLVYAIEFDNSAYVQVNGYAHTNDFGKTSGAGVVHIENTNGSHDIVVQGSATGGTAGIHALRALGSATARSYNITADFTTTNVYYPGNFGNDGDSVRGIFRSTNAGRPYFTYNNSDHDVTVIATNSTNQGNVGVQATSVAGEKSQTSGIKIRYIDVGSTTCNGTTPIIFEWTQDTVNNVVTQVGRIDATLSVSIDQSACAGYGSVFLFASYLLSGGANVLGDAGHLGNITIKDSRIRGNSQGSIFADILTAANGWGNNAKVNVLFDNVQALDETRNVNIGTGTGSNIRLSGVMAPSATLNLPDGASTIVQTYRSTFASYGATLSTCTYNLTDTSFQSAGTITCDGSNLYLRGAAAHPLRLGAGGSDYLQLNAAGTQFIPLADNAMSLGITSNRWSDVRSLTFNGLTVTPSTGTLTINNGKTLTAQNSLTFSGTDGAQLNLTGAASLTFPTSGTSGGIPYYSGTNTIASSALLGANQIMVGGGAGATPFTESDWTITGANQTFDGTNGAVTGPFMTVSATANNLTGNYVGMRITTTNTASSASTNYYGSAFINHMNFASGSDGSTWNSTTYQHYLQIQSSAAPGTLKGLQSVPTLEGVSPTGTLGTLSNLISTAITSVATGTPSLTITTYNGISVANASANSISGLTITNAIGIDVAGQVGGTTGYGIVVESGSTTNAVYSKDTTDATSVSAASVRLDGGLGIAKKLYVGTDLNAVGGNVVMGAAAKTVVLKQGANGTVGTFICSGGGTITIANTNVAATDTIIISLNAAGGTITTPPAMKTISAGSQFQVLCGATDTSTYNYGIIKNAAWLLRRDLAPAANDNHPMFMENAA